MLFETSAFCMHTKVRRIEFDYRLDFCPGRGFYQRDCPQKKQGAFALLFSF